MRYFLATWQHQTPIIAHIQSCRILLDSIRAVQELEGLGDYAGALKMYTACLDARDQSLMTPAMSKNCKGGIARCAVHQGDIKRGVAMAKGSGDAALCCQCAKVLQEMNQLQVGSGCGSNDADIAHDKCAVRCASSCALPEHGLALIQCCICWDTHLRVMHLPRLSN